MPKARSVQVGQKFLSKSHGEAIITKWNSTTDVEITFLETGNKSKTSSYQLKNGKFCDPVRKIEDKQRIKQAREAKAKAEKERAQIKKAERLRKINDRKEAKEREKRERNDRNRPTVFGVGYLGYGPYKAYISGSKPTQHYKIWKAMLARCYRKNPDGSQYYKSYVGCSVHPDWHNMQVFSKWYYDNYPDGAIPGAYQLDKDIKRPGNKIYGPYTCLFVTPVENLSSRQFGSCATPHPSAPF